MGRQGILGIDMQISGDRMCVGGQRDGVCASLGCFMPEGSVNFSLMQRLKSRRVVSGR